MCKYCDSVTLVNELREEEEGYIPVNYCPACGRALGKNGAPRYLVTAFDREEDREEVVSMTYKDENVICAAKRYYEDNYKENGGSNKDIAFTVYEVAGVRCLEMYPVEFAFKFAD